MFWLTIFMTLLSFFAKKQSGASNTEALTTAALVGAGTYYVSHETDWGRANLGQLDGVPAEGGAVLDEIDPVTGLPIPMSSGNSAGTGMTDVLKSWGGTGTAAVIGTSAAAGGLFGDLSKYVPWAIGGLAAYLLLRD